MLSAMNGTTPPPEVPKLFRHKGLPVEELHEPIFSHRRHVRPWHRFLVSASSSVTLRTAVEPLAHGLAEVAPSHTQRCAGETAATRSAAQVPQRSMVHVAPHWLLGKPEHAEEAVAACKPQNPQ